MLALGCAGVAYNLNQVEQALPDKISDGFNASCSPGWRVRRQPQEKPRRGDRRTRCRHIDQGSWMAVHPTEKRQTPAVLPFLWKVYRPGDADDGTTPPAAVVATHKDVQMASYDKREYANDTKHIEFYSDDGYVMRTQIRRRPCVGMPHDRAKLHVQGRHAMMIRVQKVLNSIWKAENDAKEENAG